MTRTHERCGGGEHKQGAAPPSRRAPSVVAKPGAFVVVSTKVAMRSLEAYLLAERSQPVVGVAEAADSREPAIAVESLRAVVGAEPRIYFVQGDYMLRRLGFTLGRELALLHGTARIWWPELSTRSDPADHPLVMALQEEPPASSAEEFARGFDLSRPRVRREIKLLEGALGLAERNLREARRRPVRADPPERPPRGKRSDAHPGDIAGAGPESAGMEESLHLLIARAWVDSLTPADRRENPLRYVLSQEFVAMVEKQREFSRERVAWVCAMVASGYAPALSGLNPHRLLTGAAGSPQLARGDGAKGWRCNLKRNAAAGPRMHYWTHPDTTIEFAAVGNHDNIGRR